MKLSRRIGTAVGLLALMAVTTLASPPVAKAADAGQIVFQGNATLPTFPCQPGPTGGTQCNGGFGGTVAGVLSGVHGSNPWSIALAQAPISATFGYSDHGDACVDGEARGSATITANAGQVQGVYAPPASVGKPLPLSLTRATISVQFNWERTGTAAVINFTDLRVTVSGPDTGSITVIDGGHMRAVAVFAPTNLDPNNPPDCEFYVNPQSLGAVVSGTGTLAEET